MAIGAAASLGATSAKADWLRAESPRFVVYSDGDEASLRQQVEQLEILDTLLRVRNGLEPFGTPEQKFSLYLVRDTPAMARAIPGVSELVRGMYLRCTDDVFAVAIRSRDDDSTTKHEYVHHFMLANFAFPYPSWLIEGVAEYFSTTRANNRHVDTGFPDQNRVNELAYVNWVPMADVLTKRPFQFRTGSEASVFYAQSWILTHYMVNDPQRNLKLRRYMELLSQGKDSLTAWTEATGLTPEATERELRTYLRRNAVYQRMNRADFGQQPVTVTRLPASYDRLMLESRRLACVDRGEEAPGLLDTVRREAAAFSGDRFADLTLASAELKLGDRAAGRAILERRLAADPNDVDVLVMSAFDKIESAFDEGTDVRAAMADARRVLARAYQRDEANWRILYGLALTRQGAPNYPNENDIDTLAQALALAPNAYEIRWLSSRALAELNRYDQAIAVLGPIAADPHGGGASEQARLRIESLRDQKRRYDERRAAQGTAPATATPTPPAPTRR